MGGGSQEPGPGRRPHQGKGRDLSPSTRLQSQLSPCHPLRAPGAGAPCEHRARLRGDLSTPPSPSRSSLSTHSEAARSSPRVPRPLVWGGHRGSVLDTPSPELRVERAPSPFRAPTAHRAAGAGGGAPGPVASPGSLRRGLSPAAPQASRPAASPLQGPARRLPALQSTTLPGAGFVPGGQVPLVLTPSWRGPVGGSTLPRLPQPC